MRAPCLMQGPPFPDAGLPSGFLLLILIIKATKVMLIKEFKNCVAPRAHNSASSTVLVSAVCLWTARVADRNCLSQVKPEPTWFDRLLNQGRDIRPAIVMCRLGHGEINEYWFTSVC